MKLYWIYFSQNYNKYISFSEEFFCGSGKHYCRVGTNEMHILVPKCLNCQVAQMKTRENDEHLKLSM